MSTEEESNLIDIPKIFYSDLTHQPLENCVKCNRNLFNSNEPYIIEKAFRYYPEYKITNTIFEYIMCLPCVHEMHMSMSKESLARIQEHLSKIDMPDRSAALKKKFGNDFESWISECIINGSRREELSEYQICGQCVGGKLVIDLMPYMMSHEASDEITSLLSAQTLEEYNRFVDDYFGLPPEFKKALKENPVLIS